MTVPANESELTLGPVLFNWQPETWRDFYFRIADEAPVETVYLGEVICFKRAPLFDDYLDAVAARLNREWAASGARVHAIDEYYRAAETEVPGLLRARGYRDAELGRHAGLTDTSLMLATDARLVRTDRLRPAREGDGVDGDPTRATAELGRAGVDLIVTRTVDAIRKSITSR